MNDACGNFCELLTISDSSRSDFVIPLVKWHTYARDFSHEFSDSIIGYILFQLERSVWGVGWDRTFCQRPEPRWRGQLRGSRLLSRAVDMEFCLLHCKYSRWQLQTRGVGAQSVSQMPDFSLIHLSTIVAPPALQAPAFLCHIFEDDF